MNREETVRDLNADLAPQPAPSLSPCPCGEAAVWYRAVQPLDATPGRGKAVSAMAAGDFHENLCAECFKAAFGTDAQTGWVRAIPGIK